MDVAGNTDLNKYVKNKKIPVRMYVEIERAICCLWLAGYIHGDLHRENIMINTRTFQVKLIDFGKYKYDIQKKKHEAKKKQKTVTVKEVQLRPMIAGNDLNIKCRDIKRFLEGGDKVKISMRFKGRELSHQEIGMGIVQKIQKDFEEVGNYTALIPQYQYRSAFEKETKLTDIERKYFLDLLLQPSKISVGNATRLVKYVLEKIWI
jgi:translation initiation factor IF-3